LIEIIETRILSATASPLRGLLSSSAFSRAEIAQVTFSRDILIEAAKASEDSPATGYAPGSPGCHGDYSAGFKSTGEDFKRTIRARWYDESIMTVPVTDAERNVNRKGG